MSKFIRTPIYHTISEQEVQRMQETPGDPPRDKERDELLTKILKYVPVEVIAIFTAATAFFSSQSSITDNTKQVYTLGALLIGLIASPVYFFYTAWNEDDSKNKPASYFYLFVLFIFPVWALATSATVREAISPFTLGSHFSWDGKGPWGSSAFNGVDDGDAEIALFIAAVIIPTVDQGLTKILARRHELQTRKAGNRVAGLQMRPLDHSAFVKSIVDYVSGMVPKRT